MLLEEVRPRHILEFVLHLRQGPLAPRRTFITLAQVTAHVATFSNPSPAGPAGDIVSIYTTLPWPALCEGIVGEKL